MLTCAILTYRRTQANVAKLLDTAGDITQGNLKRRVAIEGHDELARFGQAMDIMLDTLEQTQSELVTSQQDLRHVSKDLKQLNIELEQRVFERTDSLNNALSTLKNTQAELIKKEVQQGQKPNQEQMEAGKGIKEDRKKIEPEPKIELR